MTRIARARRDAMLRGAFAGMATALLLLGAGVGCGYYYAHAARADAAQLAELRDGYNLCIARYSRAMAAKPVAPKAVAQKGR